MNRESFIKRLKLHSLFDILIIGGGATGLGIAVDSASRGYKTILFEQSDFTKGTSSRSTKLAHGGVRYLAHGNFALVYEALQERGLLMNNAPHLVHKQKFILPIYNWFYGIKYWVGLKLYDWLSGSLSLGSSQWIGREGLLGSLPGINGAGLKGGISYFDGSFDDARLGIDLAKTATEHGARVLNYFRVIGLLKDRQGNVSGVEVIDHESGNSYKIRSKVVINATGVFTDTILKMDHPEGKHLVRPSQGAHIVLEKHFLASENAMILPETSDGRVLFAVPWQERLLVGTTDTPQEKCGLEPQVLEEEIDFILTTAGKYLVKKPKRSDILSAFAGLRPLAAPDKGSNSTKEISRSHKLVVSKSGLVTVIGGKWTTYRKMAEDTLERIIKLKKLPKVNCRTQNLKIHGYFLNQTKGHLSVYGSDQQLIQRLIQKEPNLQKKLVKELPHVRAEVVFAVRYEMARTLEDVLARRLRVLFTDASLAVKMASTVAKLMAIELNQDEIWVDKQVNYFTELADHYIIESLTPNPR